MTSPERKRPKVDPYYQGEPHPLPKTKAWFEDYQRWVAEGCPSPEEQAGRRVAGVEPGMPFETYLEKDPPPDLQELVERASRRRTSELGEEWIEDPLERVKKKAHHQGGYPHLTAEGWAEYDRAMAAWQQRRLRR
jgi:hypothetical protein